MRGWLQVFDYKYFNLNLSHTSHQGLKPCQCLTCHVVLTQPFVVLGACFGSSDNYKPVINKDLMSICHTYHQPYNGPAQRLTCLRSIAVLAKRKINLYR